MQAGRRQAGDVSQGGDVDRLGQVVGDELSALPGRFGYQALLFGGGGGDGCEEVLRQEHGGL
ncbi:hypothetical protein GCM10023317_06890 [Actinopolymorpha pittospori]|uniref:Uncharacterized protein n=1 Tax=Actinopolymorpha pittospori TaxID=648752 RepID=A0A927RG79_9ACTN|nr:hypothetical protein [Actinopolymorpha pittospori]